MKSLFVLLTALAAGCAHLTPAELRDTVTPVTIDTSQPPMRAAACVARGIENTNDAMWGSHPASVREGEKPGTAELSVVPILVADFVPAGTGSRATVYPATQPLQLYKERYLAAFKGC